MRWSACLAEPAPAPEPAHAPEPADLIAAIAANLARVVHAPAETLRLVVLCLVAEGHLIIEDFPGVGKTMLAKALARSLDCRFSRCPQKKPGMDGRSSISRTSLPDGWQRLRIVKSTSRNRQISP